MLKNFNESTQRNEALIATALVARLIAKGNKISVWDGEAFAVKKSDDMRMVLDALASTGQDILHLYLVGALVGVIVLVWGNDCDIISDNTDNDYVNELLGPIEDFAEMLQEQDLQS